ncbi:hypothetical protein [Nonomuraea sp. NPDC049684]|uniref:hypothetical protein n=1 Tax=Nonomuraea sp. NPDC049684 TaxID=3364356 RepID=UPI0037907D10
MRADLMLLGGAVGLISLLAAAATFRTTGHRREPTRTSPTDHRHEPAGAHSRGLLVGKAVVVVVPCLLGVAGLAPWLLMITPAAGFAITQSIPSFAHVDVDPSLLVGYYPLPPWAGLAVTCGYAVVALGAAVAVHRRRVPLQGSRPLAR